MVKNVPFVILALVLVALLVSGCIYQAQTPSASPTVKASPAAVSKADIKSGIRLLDSPQKQRMLTTVSALKASRSQISDSMSRLAAAAARVNTPEVLALQGKIEKLYHGNTITVLEDKLESDVDANDENLDKNSIRLNVEVNAALLLLKKLDAIAAQAGDAELAATVKELKKQFEQLKAASDNEIGELEGGLNVDHQSFKDAEKDEYGQANQIVAQENDLDEKDLENAEVETEGGENGSAGSNQTIDETYGANDSGSVEGEQTGSAGSNQTAVGNASGVQGGQNGSVGSNQTAVGNASG